MAILHEGDEPGVVTEITYEDLLRRVCRVANAMTELGVKKGDFVTLYMPMVPEAAVAMLACARLGAPHSVVFAGFSAEALRDRIVVRLCCVFSCVLERKPSCEKPGRGFVEPCLSELREILGSLLRRGVCVCSGR